MFKRFLLVHSRFGVFLGSCIGLSFWSKLDPIGCHYAHAFDSEKEAFECVDSFDEDRVIKRRDLACVPVECHRPGYAFVAECVKAGVEGWSP